MAGLVSYLTGAQPTSEEPGFFIMIEIDQRNGHGFTYASPEAVDLTTPYFPTASGAILETCLSSGSCLIEAGPGTGKSHLVSDLASKAASEGLHTLVLAAHINGGSKQGVDNALYVVDHFNQEYGEAGLLIVDNVDYYGYSGTRRTRRYPLALAHTAVAEFIGDLIEDTTSTNVCGTSHTQEWRESHWRYGERSDDHVTTIAKQLLDRFQVAYHFDGVIDQAIAGELLSTRFPDADEQTLGKCIDAIFENVGSLYFRHINHTTAVDPSEIPEELAKIDGITRQKIGALV